MEANDFLNLTSALAAVISPVAISEKLRGPPAIES